MKLPWTSIGRRRIVVGCTPRGRDRRLAAIVGIALIAVAANAPAAAQNLVANSRFDTDIAGWAHVFGSGTAEWSAVDAASAATSGSLRSTCTEPAAGGRVMFGTCVTVHGGAEYQASADVLIPTGQSRNGGVYIGVGYFASADCTGLQIGDRIFATVDPPGTWGHPSGPTTAPESAQSARVLAIVAKDEVGGAFVAHVDNVVLGGPAATSVPALSTVGAWLLVALLAGAAAMLLRRTG
jgi:hypothetical protein